MTIEVLAAIAQLCMMSAAGPLFPLRHEQLKCQKEYTACFYKLYTPRTKPGDVLAACLVERTS